MRSAVNSGKKADVSGIQATKHVAKLVAVAVLLVATIIVVYYAS